MIRATVVTPFTGTGTGTDPFRALVADDYALASWADVTGDNTHNVIPAPNTYTVVVVCDDATLAAIQADPAYVVLTAVPA